MEMTTGGIIFMILGWSGAITLMLYCVIKVLKGKTKYYKEENSSR